MGRAAGRKVLGSAIPATGIQKRPCVPTAIPWQGTHSSRAYMTKQTFRVFCRIPVTTVILWDALTCWCLTHSKMSIYFSEKNQPNKNKPKPNQKPQVHPITGHPSPGDRHVCGISIGGASPATAPRWGSPSHQDTEIHGQVVSAEYLVAPGET